MPKIIKNLENRLIEEANKQIEEVGYGAMTIRSVAKACGVGVGTVYNYFESKEMLVASFVFENWKTYLAAMERLPSHEPGRLLEGIYDLIKSFSAENEFLFSDPDAAKQMSSRPSFRHKMLRDQIAAYILPICEGDAASFTSEFIAESLIVWSTEGVEFEALYEGQRSFGLHENGYLMDIPTNKAGPRSK